MRRQSGFHSQSTLSTGGELWETALSGWSDLSHLLVAEKSHTNPQKAKLQLLEWQSPKLPELKVPPEPCARIF